MNNGNFDLVKRALVQQAKISKLQNEVTFLSESVRYNLGSLLVETLRAPLKIWKLPKSLIRLVQETRKKRIYQKAYSLIECGQPFDTLRDVSRGHLETALGFPAIVRALKLPERDRKKALEQLLLGFPPNATTSRMFCERAIKLTNICGELEGDRGNSHQGSVGHSDGSAVNSERIALCLHNTILSHENGYALRSDKILNALIDSGWDVRAYQRRPAIFDESTPDQIGNYSFLKSISSSSMTGNVLDYIDGYADVLETRFSVDKISIVHACSNYITGLAACEAAERLNLPFIYEVRGFWELTRLVSEPHFRDSIGFNIQRHLETKCARAADHVIAISEPVKMELIKRGVSADKISISRNGIGLGEELSLENSKGQKDVRNKEAKLVIGFAGSVTPYEGLETLLYAVSELDVASEILQVCIVGDGPSLLPLQNLTNSLNLQKSVKFTGRLPYSDMPKAYSKFDMVYCGRVDSLVTRLVSPLKALEGLGYGKPVIASDLPALRDLLGTGEHVLYIQPDNVSELVNLIDSMIKSSEMLSLRGDKGRLWCQNNRSWSESVRSTESVYGLVGQKKTS